jgi:hypothetical protein
MFVYRTLIDANEKAMKRMRNEYDFITDVSNRYWTDHKGRKVEISTMSDK